MHGLKIHYLVGFWTAITLSAYKIITLLELIFYKCHHQCSCTLLHIFPLPYKTYVHRLIVNHHWSWWLCAICPGLKWKKVRIPAVQKNFTMPYRHYNSFDFQAWCSDWFCSLAAHHTWSKCWLHCLPWTLSSEEHFFLLFLVKHLEELLPQGYSQHWKCVLLWQELYETNVLWHKRRLVSFVVWLKSLMYMTLAGDWAVCEVSCFVELRVQVEPSNFVWPQKWHHTISACGKVVQCRHSSFSLID